MEGRPYEKSPNGLSAGVAAALVSQGALTMTPSGKCRVNKSATLACPGNGSGKKGMCETGGEGRTRVKSSRSCKMQDARCDVGWGGLWES